MQSWLQYAWRPLFDPFLLGYVPKWPSKLLLVPRGKSLFVPREASSFSRKCWGARFVLRPDCKKNDSPILYRTTYTVTQISFCPCVFSTPAGSNCVLSDNSPCRFWFITSFEQSRWGRSWAQKRDSQYSPCPACFEVTPGRCANTCTHKKEKGIWMPLWALIWLRLCLAAADLCCIRGWPGIVWSWASAICSKKPTCGATLAHRNRD